MRTWCRDNGVTDPCNGTSCCQLRISTSLQIRIARETLHNEERTFKLSLRAPLSNVRVICNCETILRENGIFASFFRRPSLKSLPSLNDFTHELFATSLRPLALVFLMLRSFYSFPDTRVSDWVMMSSPFPTLAICLSYAYFSKVLGPKLMENRKPFDLRGVLITYNFLQTLFSTWIFYEVRSFFLCSIFLTTDY